MKIVLNLGEIGSGSGASPDQAREAFAGILAVYENLPMGVLETLEMTRFSAKTDAWGVPYPFQLEVTLDPKLRIGSGLKRDLSIRRAFTADEVSASMRGCVKGLMDELVFDAQERQTLATQALTELKSSTEASGKQ